MNEKLVDLKTMPTATTHPRRFAPLAVILFGLLVVLGLVFARTNRQPANTQSSENLVSAQNLADEYGVRINLIAVTAAGGLVDFRLKILDATKAKLLLRDKSDAPILITGERNTALTAPEDSTSQLFNGLEDNGNVFLTFPNVGGVMKPGMLVTVQFGDVRLEPITVQ
ncbi:MAG: hypothetical protein H6667_25025 [Ardenticatenaceae bacterium]|nr:hypothetical protein [Ardenticatenaceae bacterium]MCB9445268.1 hypothetical protein [Ardenticatenaceae bacterium]